jgi:hypothetical protein
MNTSTETCPSLEDLAAFLEGKLSGDERARVVAHLADCPRCYEVFAESARFQLYEEEEEDADPPEVVEASRTPAAAPPPGNVVPFPRRRIFRWISSVAAALVVIALGVPLYQQYYTTPKLSSQVLVSGKEIQDDFWSQRINRGQGDSAGFMSTHELLLGAQLVDLRISLIRKDEDATDFALAQVNDHIEELGSRVAKQATFYVVSRDQLSKGTLPRDFLQQADRMEASLRPEEYPYVDFGKWLEAGRLAALTENSDFFQARENRKFLRAFLHHELENLDPEVATTLEEIQETLAKDSLPYKDLNRLFEKVLTYYQDQSTAP